MVSYIGIHTCDGLCCFLSAKSVSEKMLMVTLLSREEHLPHWREEAARKQHVRWKQHEMWKQYERGVTRGERIWGCRLAEQAMCRRWVTPRCLYLKPSCYIF